MTEMTRRERIMAASCGKRADKLPFAHWWRHSQIGWAERRCRNQGMGVCWLRPSFMTVMHGVEITEAQKESAEGTVTRRTYSTPLGSIYLEEKREPGVGMWHASRSWKDITPWQTARLIKGPEDYPVLKYIVDHTEYVADYFPIEQAIDWVGDDGVVVDAIPHSPMQMLMIDWIGSEGGRFFYHHVDYPDLVEELYQAICASREPLYDIAARSPAPIVQCGDNVDGFLVTPQLFQQYFMPVYEKQALALHEHGKLMSVHMDGRLNSLKHLIKQTQIDIVEAFHPPPMGDLALADASALWAGKSIWLGFPGEAYALGPAATKAYALDLLQHAGAGERLVIEMSTENLVSNENLVALTSVLANTNLPLGGSQ